MAFLQNPRGLDGCFLTGNCHKLHTITSYTSDTSSTRGSPGSMANRRGSLPSARSCCRAPSYSRPQGELALCLGAWQTDRNSIPWYARCPQKEPQRHRGLSGAVPEDRGRDRECKTLVFYFTGISWALRDLAAGRHPDSSFVSPLGVSSPGLQPTATSLSSFPISTMSPMCWVNVTFRRLSRWSRSPGTVLWQRASELKKL